MLTHRQELILRRYSSFYEKVQEANGVLSELAAQKSVTPAEVAAVAGTLKQLLDDNELPGG